MELTPNNSFAPPPGDSSGSPVLKLFAFLGVVAIVAAIGYVVAKKIKSDRENMSRTPDRDERV